RQTRIYPGNIEVGIFGRTFRELASADYAVACSRLVAIWKVGGWAPSNQRAPSCSQFRSFVSRVATAYRGRLAEWSGCGPVLPPSGTCRVDRLGLRAKRSLGRAVFRINAVGLCGVCGARSREQGAGGGEQVSLG